MVKGSLCRDNKEIIALTGWFRQIFQRSCTSVAASNTRRTTRRPLIAS